MDLRLFFSWQSDSDSKKLNHTRFIRESIQAAIAKVNNDNKHLNIIYDEGMDGASGTQDMIPVIEEKLNSCHIFIGDMTIVNKEGIFAKIGRIISQKKYKASPNPNVIHESATFMARPDMKKQAIHVLNSVFGNPKDDVRLMFVDKRGKRFPIDFGLKEYNDNTPKEQYAKEQKKFVSALADAIKDCAEEAILHLDADIAPFLTWELHYKNSGFEGGYIGQGLQDYLTQIRSNSENLRICGLSGLGKTRMVLEAFRDTSVKHLYAYWDCQNEADFEVIKKKLSFMFEHYQEMVLVFDNCDVELSDSIAHFKRFKRATNPLITIYNDPDERDSTYSTPLALQKDFNDIVDRILERFKNFYKEDDKSKLKEFAGGIPMMAQLLGEGLRHGDPLGVVNNDTMMSKLLGVEKESEERKIMQSLSLFDYIGFENDLHKEVEFVAKTKSITSLDYKSDEVLLQEVDKVIVKYLRRKIMERRGRLVGIRPTPIALYLISEWIEQCSDDRLLKVIRAIQEADVAKPLTQSFADQFRLMGHNEKAKEMLNNLLGEDSPFGNAEVINTNLGSRLFRSFAEVNPVAVADCLWNALGGMTTDSLYQIDEGRRNLVWTLDKLCFDRRCFPKAAKLMMLLGIAENESIGNNATNQFKGLFPVYLPATEVSLDERLEFLVEIAAIDDYKTMALEAIGRALNTHDFMLLGGAEKQGLKELKPYHPKEKEEIIRYISGCLRLLATIQSSSMAYDERCREILCDDFARLCKFGCTDIVLPYIENEADATGFKWPKLLDTLYFVSNHNQIFLTDEQRDRIETLIINLRGDDYVSRFRDVEKRLRWDILGRDYEQLVAECSFEYAVIGKDMAANNGYDADTLKSIFKLDCTIYNGFAKAFVDNLDEPNQLVFVENCISAIGADTRLGEPILTDFLKEVSDDIFEKSIEKLRGAHLFNVIFSSVAIRGNGVDSQYWNQLINMVRNEGAPVETFRRYWTYYPISKLTDETTCKIFTDILSLPNSLSVIVHLSMFLNFGPAQSTSPKTKEVVAEAIMADSNKELTDEYWHVVHSLLKDQHRVELALNIHKRVVEHYDESHNYDSSFGIETFYDILMESYFDDVWDVISETLKNGQYSGYKIQDILSSTIRFYDEKPSKLFNEAHEVKLLEWCRKYPNAAPAILMRMMPLTTDGTLPEFAVKLVETYGDHQNVLDNLSSNMGSFAWTGSVVPLYEAQRESLHVLEKSQKENVRIWATKMIAYYDLQIKQAKNLDAEEFCRLL